MIENGYQKWVRLSYIKVQTPWAVRRPSMPEWSAIISKVNCAKAFFEYSGNQNRKTGKHV